MGRRKPIFEGIEIDSHLHPTFNSLIIHMTSNLKNPIVKT